MLERFEGEGVDPSVNSVRWIATFFRTDETEQFNPSPSLDVAAMG